MILAGPRLRVDRSARTRGRVGRSIRIVSLGTAPDIEFDPLASHEHTTVWPHSALPGLHTRHDQRCFVPSPHLCAGANCGPRQINERSNRSLFLGGVAVEHECRAEAVEFGVKLAIKPSPDRLHFAFQLRSPPECHDLERPLVAVDVELGVDRKAVCSCQLVPIRAVEERDVAALAVQEVQNNVEHFILSRFGRWGRHVNARR